MKKIRKQDVKFEIGQYIFTYRPDELISSTICELTCNNSKHPVSHIGCVIDKCNVVESLGQRKMVVMNNLYKLLDEQNVKTYLAKPLISKVISDYEYEVWLLSKLGVKYDYRNLFTFQLSKIFFGKTLRKQSKAIADNKYICSELGAESMYRRYGIISNWNEVQYNPYELFNLNEYFDYYQIVD